MTPLLRDTLHSIIGNLIRQRHLIGEITSKQVDTEEANKHLNFAYCKLRDAVDELYLVCKESNYAYPVIKTEDSKVPQTKRIYSEPPSTGTSDVPD